MPSILDLGDPVAEVVGVDGAPDPAAADATAVVSEVIDAAVRGDREGVAALADAQLVDGILQLPGAFGGLDLDGAAASPTDAPGTWGVVVGSEAGWSWTAEVTRSDDGTWHVVGVHATGGGR